MFGNSSGSGSQIYEDFISNYVKHLENNVRTLIYTDQMRKFATMHVAMAIIINQEAILINVVFTGANQIDAIPWLKYEIMQHGKDINVLILNDFETCLQFSRQI